MKKLFNYICSKVDDAELYKKEEEVVYITINPGKVKSIDGKNVIGISLRMNKDKRSGTAVSTSLKDFSIVDRAILSSKYKKEKELKFKNIKADEVKCYNTELANMSVDALVEEGLRISKKIETLDNSINFVVNIKRTISDIHIMNTEGFNDSYKKTLYSIDILTMSDEGFGQVSLSDSKTHFFKTKDVELEALVKKHQISDTHLEIETSKMPVVFSGAAMGALMTRLLAGVNSELVEKGVSPLKNKLGEKISSDLLTVYDDAILEGGFSSYKFDDEGINAQRTCIIKEGRFENFLVSVETEEKMNKKSTGNAIKKTMFSKDIEDQPAIDSSNFLVEGKSTTSDDDIIKSIEHGIYVDTVMGTHTGNINAGEYSLNVGSGYLIENGEFKGKIVDTMVSGNIYEDLFKIEAIGTKKELMRVVFYPMGYSPMVKFRDINVVGSKG